MPQGIVKKKKPLTVKKNKATKSKGNVKKGARAIAPKKGKLLEAHKMQKTFTKALKDQLESELSTKATHVESKSFKVVQSQSKSKSKSNESTQ